MTSHGLLYRNCINITNMWHFLEMLDYNHWNSQRIKKATLQQKVNTQLTSHGLLYRNCTNNTNMWHFLPRKRYNWKKLKKINLTKWDYCFKSLAPCFQFYELHSFMAGKVYYGWLQALYIRFEIWEKLEVSLAGQTRT